MSWWECGLRLFLAVVVGCVIGIEREKKNRPAGMRTHVLVCVGAAIIAIVESLIVADTMTLNLNNPGNTGIGVSYGRLSAQVISGIGFLGAGTIFISQKKIAGLTTAASLWNAACLGLAIGMQTGIVLRTFTAILPKGKVTIRAERFVSLAQKELLAISYAVTPDFACTVTLKPYLDANVHNLDSNYQETFWDMLQEEEAEDAMGLLTKTKENPFGTPRFAVAAAMSCWADGLSLCSRRMSAMPICLKTKSACPKA